MTFGYVCRSSQERAGLLGWYRSTGIEVVVGLWRYVEPLALLSRYPYYCRANSWCNWNSLHYTYKESQTSLLRHDRVWVYTPMTFVQASSNITGYSCTLTAA